jgi:OmpA-OmpF porin, OOP family
MGARCVCSEDVPLPPVTPAISCSRAAPRASSCSRAAPRASSCSRAAPRASTARFAALLLFSAVCFGLTPARAESTLDSVVLSPDQAGFSSFAATRTPGHLGFDGTLWLGYALHPLEGKDLDQKGMLLRHRVDGSALVQVGLGSRTALAVRAPFVLYQGGDLVRDAHAAVAGVGSPARDARVRVYGAGVRPDGTVVDGAALALRGVMQVPIDASRAARSYTVEDAFRVDLSAIFDVELFGVLAGGALTYRYRTDLANNGPLTQEFRLDGGVRVPMPMIARSFPGKVQESVAIEVGVGSYTKRFFATRMTPVEGRLTYRVAFSDFVLSIALGAGFNQAFGNPDFRSVLGFSYSPRKHDQDADGIPDSDDKCIHLPEDRDGFEDQDGCADDDNDGDMIVDEDDRCPLQKAEWGRDDDEDGCTD